MRIRPQQCDNSMKNCGTLELPAAQVFQVIGERHLPTRNLINLYASVLRRLNSFEVLSRCGGIRDAI